MYRLLGSDLAMRLYFDGARRASVEGRPGPDAAIYVQRAQSLEPARD